MNLPQDVQLVSIPESPGSIDEIALSLNPRLMFP